MKRKWLYIICLILVTTLVGCGDYADSNGSARSEDGRSYGGLIEAQMGDTVRTAFFTLAIESAQKCGTYQFKDGLYIADPGMTYLEVTLTVTNIYDKDLPMSISDFTLDFSDNDSEDVITGFGNTDLVNDDFMDNIFTLAKGESITKSILYTVPDHAEYFLCYKEYYEDKFEGDSYEIRIIPEVIEPAVTTEALKEPDEQEENTEDAGSDEGVDDANDNAGTDETSTEEENSSEEISDGEDTGIIE